MNVTVLQGLPVKGLKAGVREKGDDVPVSAAPAENYPALRINKLQN